ncbi:SDR family oxidoreductase [Symbioplanes lichenis]|uniref:SDR family oxidoreductase n=1 Tax=Symbioplanes lichenis TaxID=1629072 RepID=UPI0027385DA0|nr:SDR family oxidoreductase [Actinoplanes lichenis]
MSLSAASHVIVLGGSSGIGRAVAEAAAATGARVTVGSRSSGADVTSPASLAAFFAAAGAFDHLVYTAGDELVSGPITEYDPVRARDFFDVRLFRALDAVRLALPTLGASGSVTLTAGAAAFHGGPGRLLGSTIGGAVIAAARSLAIELAPIRVNVVAPGIVRTPLWSQAPEGLLDRLGAGTLLGRVAEPSDAAKAYVALLDQDYVTGTVALVDGGSVLK